MKRILAFIMALCFGAAILSGCGESQGISGGDGSQKKLTIVASLFPQFDFARQIVGDKATVTLLLPPGTESHTYDPTPLDITNIHDSDIFIYTGKNMEPWADRIISGINDQNITILDVTGNINLVKDDHDSEAEEDHDHEYDPHVWLDPTLSMKMVDNILKTLCEKDPVNADFYRTNAENYKQQLQKLDDDIFEVVENAKKDTIVFGGRFAYIYFINHFGLKYVSAYDNCSAETEPSMKRIGEIIEFIKTNQISCIFYEELADPKMARTIAEEAGIEMALFSTAHNITRDEKDAGITYIDIMRNNLESLKKGLS